MNRKLLLILVICLIILIFAVDAVDISSCTNINSPGEYVLTADITDSPETACINITVSDVIFDGAGNTISGMDTSLTQAVYAHHPLNLLTNVTVKNLRITHWNKGINYWRVNNGRVEGNTVEMNYVGFYFYRSGNNIISNNNVSSSNSYGIYVAGSSLNNNISNNIVNSSNQAGIYILQSSNFNTIMNNILIRNSDGLKLAVSHNNTITSNIFNSSLHNGIYLYSSNHNIFTDNEASDNWRNGIWIWGTSVGNSLNSNRFCFNSKSTSYYDISDESSNSGDENTCDTTNNWNDIGATGCTYACTQECIPEPEVCDGVDNDCDGDIDEGFDMDSDGIADCHDNCPIIINPDQADSDGDGIGDVCDNCYNYYNPAQEESNSDGVGDACDIVNFTIYLEEGWNLVSFPLNFGLITARSLNETLNGSLDSILFYYQNDSYSGWHLFFNNDSMEANNLNVFDPSYGFWMKVKGQVNLTLRAPRIYTAKQKMYAGWNLMGYPWDNTVLGDAFGNELNYLDMIFVYDTVWISWVYNRSNLLNAFNQLVPGYGIWIKANKNRNWSIDSGIIG